MLYGFNFFTSCSICSVEIDAVQQRLASKIEVLWNDSAAARRAAPGTLPRRSAARPVEMVSLIRVEAISSGDRGAAVPRCVRLWWKRAFTPGFHRTPTRRGTAASSALRPFLPGCEPAVFTRDHAIILNLMYSPSTPKTTAIKCHALSFLTFSL